MTWQLEVVNARTNDSHFYDFAKEPESKEFERSTVFYGETEEGKTLVVGVNHENTLLTSVEQTGDDVAPEDQPDPPTAPGHHSTR